MNGESQWLRRHATIAPFTILAATVFVAWVFDGSKFQWPAIVESIASFVDLVALLYSIGALAIERGINMVWWAIEQHKKRERARIQAEESRIEQAVQQAVQKAIEDARNSVIQAVLEKVRQEDDDAKREEWEAWLEGLMSEKKNGHLESS